MLCCNLVTRGKTMSCFLLIRRISIGLFFSVCLTVILPALGAATSASISLSGNEGAIPLNASASFTKHKFCNSKKPPDCWYNDSGTLRVTHARPNGSTSYMGGNSGNGSAEWSTTLDSGAMAQGAHTFTARACDSKSICQSSSQSVTIDNTPILTGSAGSNTGDLQIGGTVQFKEHVRGSEGRVQLWYVHPNGRRYYAGQKVYQGTGSLDWSWEEIIGSVPDGGSWAQGEYTIQAIAIAHNGASTQHDISITIDNTPVLSGSAGSATGDLQIGGTVQFKEHIRGSEGRVQLWYVHPNGRRYYAGQKVYQGTGSLDWSWEEIIGSVPDGGSWAQGEYTIQAIAIARNGASTQHDISIVIDNTPELSGSAGNTAGDLDIKGTVQFKEHVRGSEGRVQLWYVHPNGRRYYAGQKYYQGTESLTWSWQEIVGSIPDGGSWAQGEYTIQAIAIARNGVSTQHDIPITIDNTPVLTGSAGSNTGDLQIGGTVHFQEHVRGSEGRVQLWYVHPNGRRYYAGQKVYQGTESLTWSWQKIVGSIPDGGSWAQGEYTIQAIAIARNGASSQHDIPITIDNTPEVTIIGPRYYPDLTFDIIGTATFKEHVGGNDGSLSIALKEIHQSRYTNHGTKNYNKASNGWSYSGIIGSRLSSATWGTKELMVQITARAANGATATVQRDLMIPARGCPFP
jgi:hypothetical protein